MKALWTDPAFRERMIAARKTSWEDPDRRARASRATSGKKNGFYGKTHSDATKEKIREAAKNRPPETLAKMSAAHKGQSVPAERRARISATLKGRVKPPEERANISAGLRGRKLSPESREKIAASLRGRRLPHEVKEKIGAASRGSKNPSAKLSEDDVREIRQLLGTQKLTSIARQFGVSIHAIRRIRDGETWTHVS